MPKLDVPERLNIFVQDNTRCVPVVQVYNRVTHGLPTSSVEDDHLTKVSPILKPGWIAIDVDGEIPLGDAQSKVGCFRFPFATKTLKSPIISRQPTYNLELFRAHTSVSSRLTSPKQVEECLCCKSRLENGQQIVYAKHRYRPIALQPPNRPKLSDRSTRGDAHRSRNTYSKH